MAVTIRDIRVICTAPEGINLVVVKVETRTGDFADWDVEPLLTATWL